MGRQRPLHVLACCGLIVGVVMTATALPAAQLWLATRDASLRSADPRRTVSAPPLPPSPSRSVESVPPAYRSLIHEIAARHEQPPELVESIIRVESNFNPRAVSRKGARGLMQLMPETARRLGVRNVFDTRENIEAGVRHLRYLSTRFSGDVRLALAAYNAGEGPVKRHLGIPPYGETQAYVARVLELSGWLEARPLGWAPEAVAEFVPDSRRVYRPWAVDTALRYVDVPAPLHPARH